MCLSFISCSKITAFKDNVRCTCLKTLIIILSKDGFFLLRKLSKNCNLVQPLDTILTSKLNFYQARKSMF